MKAFLIGKTVNIEFLVTDFCDECLRVSSMPEMDWDRFEKSDVVFTLFGEFEKPEDLEVDVVTVQLFSADQAQEISLRPESSGQEFYLPFECDKQDIEDLWIMLLAVLPKEEINSDIDPDEISGMAEGTLEELPGEEELLAAEGEALEDDEEIDLEEIDLEEINEEDEVDEEDDLDFSPAEGLDTEQGLEELEMSTEDDDIEVEFNDGDEGELTSDVVDIDFGDDDEMEVDDESSELFMTSTTEAGAEDDTDINSGEFDLEFGEGDEEELDADEVEVEESIDMDRTGDFELSGDDEIEVEEEDHSGEADILEFSGGDDMEVEDDDVVISFDSADDDESGDIEVDLTDVDDDETEKTLIANDLDALKAEAKERRDKGEVSIEDGESIEAEDGFVLETYEDEEDEVELSGDDAELDIEEMDFSGGDDDEDVSFSLDEEGDGDDSFAFEDDADPVDFELGEDNDEGEVDFDLGTDSGFELDGGGGGPTEGPTDFDMEGGLDLSPDTSDEDNSNTVTGFSSSSEEDSTGEFNVDDMEMDFGGGGGDDNSYPSPSSAPAIPSSYNEPPPVRSDEVLNFGGVSDEKDLMNMHSTIREIREERSEFLNRIQQLESMNKSLRQENLTLKAEVDEKRIELSVIQKRQISEREDIREKLGMSEEKKLLFEEKLRRVEREYQKLEQRVHIDVEKVRKRERELENQLELIKMDAQSQIKTRDTRIMDLKRKIDSLEFNVKTSSKREQKNLEDKLRVESRLEKVMEQLRSSIGTLEEEASVDDIKKLESH